MKKLERQFPAPGAVLAPDPETIAGRRRGVFTPGKSQIAPLRNFPLGLTEGDRLWSAGQRGGGRILADYGKFLRWINSDQILCDRGKFRARSAA